MGPVRLRGALLLRPYPRLEAGAGALILFAAVQATMIGWAIAAGERPRSMVWLGLLVALGGLIGLTAPGASAPDPLGAAAMATAGAAWGVYSLRGRRSGADALAATVGNFLRSLPLGGVLFLGALAAGDLRASPRGLLLAALSGTLASGLGYSVWYAALRGLAATRAAVAQLVVPVLAAGGRVLLLGEALWTRLVPAGGAILCGVTVAIRGRS